MLFSKTVPGAQLKCVSISSVYLSSVEKWRSDELLWHLFDRTEREFSGGGRENGGRHAAKGRRLESNLMGRQLYQGGLLFLHLSYIAITSLQLRARGSDISLSPYSTQMLHLVRMAEVKKNTQKCSYTLLKMKLTMFIASSGVQLLHARTETRAVSSPSHSETVYKCLASFGSSVIAPHVMFASNWRPYTVQSKQIKLN